MHKLRFTGNASRDEFVRRCAAQDLWYHSFYFDNEYEVRGMWNIGMDIESYGFPSSLAGASVLDLGTGSGWFAFFFWQEGADVTATDVRGYCDFDYAGRNPHPAFDPATRAPDRHDKSGLPVYFSSVSGGFWIMNDMLQAPIRFHNARVYDIGPEMFAGQQFDIVFLGSLLCHLRDPIRALAAARSVCRGVCIASTPLFPNEPESGFSPRQYLLHTAIDPISWWMPNEACYRQWFLAAGFQTVDLSREARLRCDVPKRIQGGRIVNSDMTLRVAHAK